MRPCPTCIAGSRGPRVVAPEPRRWGAPRWCLFARVRRHPAALQARRGRGAWASHRPGTPRPPLADLEATDPRGQVAPRALHRAPCNALACRGGPAGCLRARRRARTAPDIASAVACRCRKPRGLEAGDAQLPPRRAARALAARHRRRGRASTPRTRRGRATGAFDAPLGWGPSPSVHQGLRRRTRECGGWRFPSHRGSPCCPRERSGWRPLEVVRDGPASAAGGASRLSAPPGRQGGAG